jgi:hypothetical protein
MSRSLAVTAAALARQAPDASPDDVLRRVAADGPADVHPVLWAEVKREGLTTTARHEPSE